MKAMVGLVLAILIIFGLRLFWPASEPAPRIVSQDEIMSVDVTEITDANDEEASSSSELYVPSDDEKRKLMMAEYDILEEQRKKLKRHIARLKHDMWGMTFTPEKAKEISKTVLGASKLLKNPNMLGAFLSVKEIKDEIAKIEFAAKSLEQVDEIIIARKAESENSQDQTSSAIQ